MEQERPLLRRDDPNTDPLVGNIKVTRDDWLNIALAALIADGVEGVKVQPLAARLGVSRSSFYWYFKSRQDLLDALLDRWQKTNTAALIRMSEKPSATITEAVGNVFRCVINPALFDTRLDFAIRDWARRSDVVRAVLMRSDDQRLTALRQMFERHDYGPLDAEARARILYYMQIGYDDAQLAEPMSIRNELMPSYLIGFTGKAPTDAEVADLKAYALSLENTAPID